MNETQQSHWNEPQVYTENSLTEAEIFLEMLNDCIFEATDLAKIANGKLSCVIKPNVQLMSDSHEPIWETWSPVFSEMRSKLIILKKRIEETKFCIEHTQLPNLGVLK